MSASALRAALALAACLAAMDSPPVRALESPPPFEAAFERAPLEIPLRLTSGFGDHRSNHFHAGLDFSTGRRVGRAVIAPLSGVVERVRASGTGYGRSLYMRSADGRLLVFGHLDAFTGSLARWVAAVQDSTGDYEQDLWPEPGRFRFAAGDTIAWSGESGAGGPHLHLEVRRGDMALHPLRAGLAMADTVPPAARSIVFEPLDDTSHVAPAGAVRWREDGTPVVTGWGRLRAIVEVGDALVAGGERVSPWRVRLEDGGTFVECRFDSVSWATDMSEADLLYDRGRATSTGSRSLVMWAPPGFRPRVLSGSAPLAGEAGVITIGPGGDRTLRVIVEDLAGRRDEREVRLEAGRRPGPPPRGRAAAPGPDAARLRVDDVSREARLELGERCVVTLPAGALFAPATLTLERADPAAGSAELTPVGDSYRLAPALEPMRRAARVGIAPPAGASARRVGLYRASGSSWEFVGAARDLASGRVEAETRRPGRFALMRDRLAPRITLRAPRPAAGGPYSRWALEARLGESGSGVDARASWLVVDGRRVPSEWDAEARVLRWRPLEPPSRGTHRVAVVAADRAGNTARAEGDFVVD